MSEEDRRWLFLVPLNIHYEGQATGETFNFKGKTDIIILVDGKCIFIAECKVWDGPKSLTAAIDQILRYTTWRDGKTAILLLNRDRKMTAVLDKVASTVGKHPSCVRQHEEYSHETGFRFTLKRPDDPSRQLTLTVLVFEVPKD